MASNEKLYLGVNGRYYQDYELANAYFLATGNDFYADENASKRFDIWVHDLIGLSIEKIVSSHSLSPCKYDNPGYKRRVKYNQPSIHTSFLVCLTPMYR